MSFSTALTSQFAPAQHVAHDSAAAIIAQNIETPPKWARPGGDDHTGEDKTAALDSPPSHRVIEPTEHRPGQTWRLPRVPAKDDRASGAARIHRRNTLTRYAYRR